MRNKSYRIELFSTLTAILSVGVSYLFLLNKSLNLSDENKINVVTIIISLSTVILGLTYFISKKRRNIKGKIFIIYRHSDKDFVYRLRKDLYKNGFNVDIDEDILSIGDNIVQKINKTIENSDIVLIILNSNSVVDNGFFSNEILKAISVKKEVIPIVIGGENSIIPDEISDIKFSDFTLPNKYGENLFKLSLALNRKLRDLKNSTADSD